MHVERDVRLLVHGDDFMVEMPTHEEKWLESVLFSKYDGKSTEKFQSDGNTAMEASFLNRVIRWDHTSGRAELEASSVVTPVAKRPKSEELLMLAGAKPLNAQDTSSYKSVTMRLNNFVSGPRRLVICYKLSGTRDEESHDQGP